MVCLGFSALALEVNLLEIDLTAAPGQVLTFSFIARNERTIAELFTIYLGDWNRDEQGGNRFYPPGTLPRSCSPWISLSPLSFTLGPGEAREVTGTLRVPATGVTPGTYWSIAFVQGEPRPTPYQGTIVMVTPRIGIKVYVTVGTTKRVGEVRGLELKGLNPFWLTLRFLNTGTLNLREVRAEARVFDATGNLVAQAQPVVFPCLPGGERVVRLETNFRPAPGTYLVVAKVDMGGDAILAAQASLRVRPLSLTPLVGTSVPQDLDGDGFYEDLSGDRLFNETDVALFLERLASPPIQNNWRAFDFNNDGRVDKLDADALGELLKARSS